MMIEMLISGPIVAIVFEGIDIVEVVRKLVGATEPKRRSGTIRGISPMCLTNMRMREASAYLI